MSDRRLTDELEFELRVLRKLAERRESYTHPDIWDAQFAACLDRIRDIHRGGKVYRPRRTSKEWLRARWQRRGAELDAQLRSRSANQ